ncbi:MAG: hypothetical protein LBN00_01275 [Oscillospiraceae bacterium]|jgi:hypothetical protein|nr:hypothetical protein [Oscillospiraceae bacterium]
MDNNERRPRPMGLNIGSASIIMLFAVLCLTVLSALSLLSANSQYTLAERSAEAAKAYYAADYKAMEIYESVKSGDYSQVETVSLDAPDDGNYVSVIEYTVEIDEHQTLAVTLLQHDDGSIDITEWKIIESGDWTPNDFFDLWSGE